MGTIHVSVFDFSVADDHYTILKGQRHLCDPTTAAKIASTYGGQVVISEYAHPEPIKPRALLAIRHGAFGDLLFLTPTLRTLKSRAPDTPILLAASGHYRTALLHNPCITALVSYPPLLSAYHDCYILSFEYSNEVNERLVHAADVFGLQASVSLISRKIEVFVCPSAKAVAVQLMGRHRTSRPLIGIQTHASNKVRSYPRSQLDQLINALTQEYQCLLFTEDDSLSLPERENQLFVHQLAGSVGFPLCVALVQHCDAFIGPDSALSHVAAALHIPLIALFGPFPSRLRVESRKDIVAIDGEAPCAPCFHHTRSGRRWPKGKPCERADYCVALEAIKPEHVTLALNSILKPKWTPPSE